MKPQLTLDEEVVIVNALVRYIDIMIENHKESNDSYYHHEAHTANAAMKKITGYDCTYWIQYTSNKGE